MDPSEIEFHFPHQTVVITGASGGIGRAVAWRFVKAGARVILHANANVESVAELTEKIRVAGGTADFFEADFSHEGTAAEFVRSVYNKVDQVDVWVNAAGVDLMSPALSGESFGKKMRKIFDVDVFATIEMSRKVGERMFEKKTGTIFFFSWNGVHFGWNTETAQIYGAAKGALLGVSRSLGECLAPHVRVRCLSLGWIKTHWGKRTSGKIEADIRRDSLLGRWGNPEEIADATLFLASDASAFVDGIDVRLDGGKRGAR